MIIRRELAVDGDAVRAVHAGAFGRPGEVLAAEARLVDELRADGAMVPGLSLVAELDGAVAGHVVCSRAHLDGEPVLGLGPLGVVPPHQRRGVGTALMHAVVAAADALDEPCVVLLGSPRFYSRFGFVPAQPAGIRPPDPAWVQHFQLRRLTHWRPMTGEFRYAPAFERL